MLQSSIVMEIESHELTNQPPPKEIDASRIITYIQLLQYNALVLMQRDKESGRKKVLSCALMKM